MIYKILIVAAIIAYLFIPVAASKNIENLLPPDPVIIYVPVEPEADPNILTHAQETWISALEWCESNAKPSAVNPNDSDGTPSYYSYQFKPSTFKGLGEQYGIISKGQSDIAIMSLMEDTAIQRAIVRKMIKDTSIDIGTQFPGCVRKIGYPPVY